MSSMGYLTLAVSLAWLIYFGYALFLGYQMCQLKKRISKLP